jgi:uncharacterized repeat protein (TIGR02543 family)
MLKFANFFLFLGLLVTLAACQIVEEQTKIITITFETNNESSLHPLTFIKGSSPVLPQLGSSDDYIFEGWYLDPVFMNPVVSLNSIEENATLYAKWIMVTYDILIDVYKEVKMKSVHMNEIALFILDELNTLYVQINQENPLAKESEWAESLTFADFTDPNDDNDTLIYTWEMNAFVVDSGGSIYAWGDNTYGQLGTEDKKSHGQFVEITDAFNLEIDETIVKIVGNKKTTFALTSHGELYAWGANDYELIGEKDTLERLTPTNIKDQLCGQTDHFLVDNGLCGETDHFIIDIEVTDYNAMILTNYHQVFLWGRDATHWFDRTEVTSANISEVVYHYFSGHVERIVASSSDFVLISELDEILILGDSKLGAGKDHSWAGGPVSMTKIIDTDGNIHPDMLELMSHDRTAINDLKIDEAYLVGDTLMLHFSNGTLWGLGDNTNLLISHKKGYDYYKALSEVSTNFVPTSIAMSSNEVCAVDDGGSLWCWGKGSSKNLNQNNEMIIDTEYRHISYQGDETNFEGELENPDQLRSSLSPIKWMAPESLIAAPFALPYRVYTFTRYHVSAIPPTIKGIAIAAILNQVCIIGSGDCDDDDPVVHPEAWDIYKATDGVIRYVFEVGIARSRAHTTEATYQGE